MLLAKQELPERPTIPSPEVIRLRANIIFEEALETLEGLGYRIVFEDGVVDLKKIGEPDIVKAMDGCADLRVVTTGTMSAFGVDDEPIQELVDANNLEKFGPGSYRRESDGKWMKSPSHKPPDIQGELLRQGWRV